jgi:hypothetical protein
VVDLWLIGNALRVQVLGWRKLLTFISRFDIHVGGILRARVGPLGWLQFRSTDRRLGDAVRIVVQTVEQIAERIGEAKGTMSLRVES